MNGRESYCQTAPHGYRQFVCPRADRPPWWLNRYDRAESGPSYADHLVLWSRLQNAAGKPPVGDREAPSNPLLPDQFVMALIDADAANDRSSAPIQAQRAGWAAPTPWEAVIGNADVNKAGFQEDEKR